MSEECIRILEERVIQGPIADRFEELMQSGQSPVYLFSTRKACEEFNSKMLSKLQCKTVEICCTDEVDETKGMHKWSKKEAEELKRLNKDCNLTAGLEVVLHIGVGARVMLCRNTNTSLGLVNGALGTVVAIGAHKVTVKFDHMSTEYEVEKVKSRFIVMRRVYVYRVQFPLTLAYAITIHKCQGLSLDCAMMDLSDQVFSSAMAYVALSRVRTLDGVHLVAFDQKSIMVSSKSLLEINRLRQLHRPDLMVYALLHEQSANRKRKLRGTCMILPNPKKQKENLKEKNASSKHSQKRPLCLTKQDKGQLAKKNNNGGWNQLERSSFRFHPVDSKWQNEACSKVGVQYQRPCRFGYGSPDCLLAGPNFQTDTCRWQLPFPFFLNDHYRVTRRPSSSSKSNLEPHAKYCTSSIRSTCDSG